MTVHGVAIVGAGVIGASTALAIKRSHPDWNITIVSDRPFEETCSYGPAGIFRIDPSSDPRIKRWAVGTFCHFAELYRTHSASHTGVKLISGFIQSDDKATLQAQEKIMSDIVYNFSWLKDEEMKSLFQAPSRYAIHFTTYSSEGSLYVPWLIDQLSRLNDVEFRIQKLESLNEFAAAHNFDVIVNCAGIDGGKLTGDDDTVFPIRGVALKVTAGGHKHFNYRNFDTFTIPLDGDTVLLGTLKQANRYDLAITDEDRDTIWRRYLNLHPSFKTAKVVGEWSGLRPARPTVRLEQSQSLRNANGAECKVIHNYGHGGNGFTLSWGCAINVLKLLNQTTLNSKL